MRFYKMVLHIYNNLQYIKILKGTTKSKWQIYVPKKFSVKNKCYRSSQSLLYHTDFGTTNFPIPFTLQYNTQYIQHFIYMYDMYYCKYITFIRVTYMYASISVYIYIYVHYISIISSYNNRITYPYSM